MSNKVSGSDPGQRRLNGPQTTGRDYRNLSQPEFEVGRTTDVSIALRDGAHLLADVYRPTDDGKRPALLAFSAYPRQIQDLGAPLGMIEAGASDFFVPRGYAHVIANARGTSGSEGIWTFFGQQERDDLFDLVEWVARQPWCDGQVGMIGISYFAMAQLAAAAAKPPSLKAIFPLATNESPYDVVWHHGVQNRGFISAWMAAVGVLADKTNDLWRSRKIDLARHLFDVPAIHRKLEHFNGEAVMTVLQKVIRSHPADEPYMRLWQEATVEHPIYDQWWAERDVGPMLADVDIPVYLGCDWDNSIMHLPGTFSTWRAIKDHSKVRMSLLPVGALTWPWESMHYEALAWFDHWFKDRDTGIMDGPAVRYYLQGADEWRTSDVWPPRDSAVTGYSLRSDGTLALDEGDGGSREYLYLSDGAGRPAHANPTTIPSKLEWSTEAAIAPLDFAGDIELQLDASTTTSDTSWIAVLSDDAPDGTSETITAGWLRASLRTVNSDRSKPGTPILDCDTPVAVPIGETVTYRIPIVANARRIAAGHRLRLSLSTADDNDKSMQVLGFIHAPVGDSSRNIIYSSSRLLLPILKS